MKYFFYLLFFPMMAHATVQTFGGFETGDFTEAGTNSGTASIETTTVHTGTYALQINPTTTGTGLFKFQNYSAAGIQTNGATSLATVYTRFYFNVGTLPASNDEEIYKTEDSSNNNKLMLRINSSGNLVVYDTTTIAISTGSTVLATNTWYRIEMQTGTGSTAQTFNVKINGASELTGTALSGSNNNSQIFLGKSTNRNGNTVNFYYDDYQLNDTGFPGAGQTSILVAVATGTFTTWSIGAGNGFTTHWKVIKDVPNDGDTSYLVDPLVNTDADTSQVTTGSSAGITGTVNGVKAMAIVKRDGASNGNMKTRLVSNGTTSDLSGTGSAGSIYTEKAFILTTDPATSSAWTLSALNTLEVGAVDTDITNKARMTSAYIMVDYTPSAGGAVTPMRTLMGVGL